MSIVAGVYCIENIYNGKMYIGSALKLNVRISGHFSLLKRGKSHNNHLQASYDKYGKEAFIGYIIESCERSQVKEREQFWIDNTTCLTYGYNKSNKVIDNSGWNHSQKLKDQLSRDRLGEKNPQFGVKLTDQQKEVIRKNSTGRNHTNSAIEKMIKHRREHKNKYVGSKCGKAILTEKQVYEIKVLLSKNSHSFTEIAKMYNVASPTIGGIFTNRRWSHVVCKKFEEYKKTYKINSRQSGALNINAKLTEQDVINIRSIRGKSYAEIGRIYNISDVSISNIIKKKTWKNVIAV